MIDKSTSCGLFNWRPQWAQRLASRGVYLALFSIVGIIQSMAFSYLTTVLSTIEKRFGLKSKEATWIYSGNEISQIFFIFFLPFVGRVKKRPLFMGLSIMLSALGLLIIAFPHFTGEQAYLTNIDKETSEGESGPKENICGSGKIRIEEGECDGQSFKDWASLGVVFSGIFLLGFGVSFYFSFGIPFIDDNTKRSNSPFSLSLVFASRIIGPTLGFMLGSACLALYVDPGKAPHGITEDHPRWIGAWWIGFVVIAILLMIFAPWLTLFPERFSSSAAVETDADKIARQLAQEKEPKTAKEWWREFKEVATRLFSSKVYILQNISGAFFLFAIMGFALFIPKFIEFHYRQRASTSGASGGVAKTVSSVVGLLVSGWIMSRWRFKARALAGWCVGADVLAIIGVACISLFACPPSHFPNVDGDAASIIMRSCNRDCGCAGIPYTPVCSNEDGVTNFFSPCHAGCQTFENINGNITYTNCECLKSAGLPPPGIVATGNFTYKSGSVKPGVCPVDCTQTFYMLLAFLFVFSLVGSTTRIPNFLLSIRSIEKRDKSASITFSVSFLSLFAFLPSPIVYGAILDTTCVLFDTTKCGETTHCLIYDTDAMRNLLAFLPAAFMVGSLICDIGVFYYCKELTIYDEEEEVETHEMNDKGFKEIDLNQ